VTTGNFIVNCCVRIDRQGRGSSVIARRPSSRRYGIALDAGNGGGLLEELIGKAQPLDIRVGTDNCHGIDLDQHFGIGEPGDAAAE
jgi:hypothetical protein